ncbi:MAG: transglycosylase domain-containing protein [Bacteroidetes bacterium]|nr:transglycosylase domain-containing protein [Bacteroidota bacterium]
MAKNSKYIAGTWMIIWLPFLIILLIVSLVANEVLGDLPSVEELQNPRSNLATVIYSSDGKELGKYYNENRVNVTFKDLDKDLVDALVATEDARFYEHNGVDIKALLRSASGVFTGGSKGGGSTITQQLAKMMFPREKLSKFQLVIRKIKEWVIATRLEKNYTKEEIMAMYLNKFDFLNLAVGVKSAAKIYFNSNPDSLRIEQAAMLVGMAQNPSLYNPIRFEEKTKHRRNVVLSQMLKYGYINQTQFDTLKIKPLGLSFRPEDHNEGPAPYFREYLRENFLKQWCENHINPETKKPYNIYKDGLRVYTTIDSRMQQYAEEAVAEHMLELQKAFIKDCKQKRNAPFAYNVKKEEIQAIMTSSMKRSDRYRELKQQGLSKEQIEKNFNTPAKMTVWSIRGEIDTTMTPMDSIRYYKGFLQTGFMAVDPQTGQVRAWVGGINHKHFKYDHVKVGKRQVGSTFKPFVYAMAIQEGYSPCYQMPCVKTCVTTEDGKEWCPDNSFNARQKAKWENRLLTLKQALALSVNYISAALMKKFGPYAVVNLAKRMGITSHLDPVPSLCLGTADISVFEMVGAIATFPNQGTFVQPTFITRIEDKNGKVLEEFMPQTDEVFSPEKAYVMCQLMKGVVQHGTGMGLAKYKLGAQIGGKTGTTQNNSDGWFIGYTPDLAAGCWVGAEDRSVHFNSTDVGQGATMAMPIWGKFFQKALNDPTLKLSKGDFVKPDNLGDIELDCAKYELETIPGEDFEEGGF